MAALDSILNSLGDRASCSCLLSQFMEVVFLGALSLPSLQLGLHPRQTWHVSLVLSHLKTWGSIMELSPRQLGMQTFASFLLFSCWGIINLTLHCVDAPFYNCIGYSVTFQLKIGLK